MQNYKLEGDAKEQGRLDEVHRGGEGPQRTVVWTKKKKKEKEEKKKKKEEEKQKYPIVPKYVCMHVRMYVWMFIAIYG